MYKSFLVKNFRCFKDLQINDLGRVNLIAGRNNTGKSALLEAMYLHTRPDQTEVLLHLQQARDLDIPLVELPSYWSHYFYGLDSAYDIHITGENDAFAHCLTMFEALRTRENEHHFEDCVFALIEQGVSDDEAYRLARRVDAAFAMHYEPTNNRRRFAYLYSNGSYRSYRHVNIPSNFIPVQGRPNKVDAVEQFSKIVRNGYLSELLKTLSALDQDLNELRILRSYGEQLLWGGVRSGYFPLKLMGEGVNRVNHFMITLMSNPSGYIFIDEIENGVHYSAHKEVWKAIGQVARDLNIQVFATTHSLEMIRAAYKAFSEEGKLDEFRFLRLNRSSKTDEIEAVTYNEFGVDAAMSTNWEVRG